MVRIVNTGVLGAPMNIYAAEPDQERKYQIWDNENNKYVDVSKEEYEKYNQTKFAPIDPIWKKAQMWIGLSDRPVTASLTVREDTQHYVITKTRAFTHRTFFLAAMEYKCFISPTPMMIESIFEESLRYGMVGEVYMKETEDFPNRPRVWWNRIQKELHFNTKKWLDETSEQDVLKFLDPANISVKEEAANWRTDGYADIYIPFSVTAQEIR